MVVVPVWSCAAALSKAPTFPDPTRKRSNTKKKDTDLNCALRVFRRCPRRGVSDKGPIVRRLVLVREKQNVPSFVLGDPLQKDRFKLRHFGVVVQFQKLLVGYFGGESGEGHGREASLANSDKCMRVYGFQPQRYKTRG